MKYLLTALLLFVSSSAFSQENSTTDPLKHSDRELPSHRHMILPKSILPDIDGDGIADQFDRCPGTPAGIAVDGHGCPRDRDGDGVPDYRDKELITPTDCQPVDADGVGMCPCYCEVHSGTICCSIAPGIIIFPAGSSRITADMDSQFARLAVQMQASPDCKVVVLGKAGSSKLEQQRSWDRVNAVIEYMSRRKYIDRSRFIFRYSGGVFENGVNYRSPFPGEEGPGYVAPPHPNLHRQPH